MSRSLGGKAAIAGIGQTEFSKASGRSELQLACESVKAALDDAGLAPRVQAWRAELAYFQGRYAEATALVERLAPALERAGDLRYAAFALRVRIAILLARGDYAAVDALAGRAVALARASGDAYVEVQVHNVLGAVHFDRATSKLREPHARAQHHAANESLHCRRPLPAPEGHRTRCCARWATGGVHRALGGPRAGR